MGSSIAGRKGETKVFNKLLSKSISWRSICAAQERDTSDGGSVSKFELKKVMIVSIDVPGPTFTSIDPAPLPTRNPPW
jgi:hypothetical protein